MKTPFFYLKPILCLSLIFYSLFAFSSKTETVISPDNLLKIEFSIDNTNDAASYAVSYDGSYIVKPSLMGFKIKNEGQIGQELNIKEVVNNSVRNSWKPIYGEKNEYPENYNESIITLANKEDGTEVIQITLRAYNEGVAFRYKILGEGDIEITDELTEVALLPDGFAWVTEMSQGVISKMQISDIEGLSERPLLVKYADSLYVALGEAAQIDYARTKFKSTKTPGLLKASLGSNVTDKLPLVTPWRYVMAGKSAGQLLEQNYLILNLNEPNKLGNQAWLKPGKVIREMSLSTVGAKAYIDFAAEHGIQYIIESAGWYGDPWDDESDATTVTVDPRRGTKRELDMAEIVEYAKQKGIGVMLYVDRRELERDLDVLLPLYKSWGIVGIKYGFVKTDSQEMCSWLHEAIRKSADYEMILSVHDDYRPVGYTRTYPNLMTQEGIRGDEESIPNEQTLRTMFTRMLAGAGDNTICYFNSRVDEMGSHASQLAKAVCLYSPLQWLYWYDRPVAAFNDIKVHYSGKSVIVDVPELEFFTKMPTVWDDTKVIHSEVGALGTIARKNGDNWYVGTINGSEDRLVSIPLDFLDDEKKYEAVIYYDDENVNTVTRVGVKKMKVNSKSKISREIIANNGLAIIISPK